MIVDTSVWVDAFREVHNKQTELVAEYIMADRRIYVTPTIIQDVLQGVRMDNRYAIVKEGLLAQSLLKLDPIEAADLYRSLRRKGVTIRKPNDCLIAH